MKNVVGYGTLICQVGITIVGSVMDCRNYRDPKYRMWRKRVFRRDRWLCRMCGIRGPIQAHHIKRWANHPPLRFLTSNGITLCVNCHEKTKGREEEFESMFTQLIRPQYAAVCIKLLLMRYGQEGQT